VSRRKLTAGADALSTFSQPVSCSKTASASAAATDSESFELGDGLAG